MRASCGESVSSPRTRGWSRARERLGALNRLFPAHAGVVPRRSVSRSCSPALPRARGGGPPAVPPNLLVPDSSPRTRGWSPFHRAAAEPDPLFPAHAGVVPGAEAAAWTNVALPRARGGGPERARAAGGYLGSSPRTRGWSQAVGRGQRLSTLFPAHAGVVPAGTCPAEAGPALPRARGGGPSLGRLPGPDSISSPRTRGWSARKAATTDYLKLFPAHAGVVPRTHARAWTRRPLPRARGGGPNSGPVGYGDTDSSPRTRGWSCRGGRGARPADLFPAHAGVVPQRVELARGRAPLPRARGGGPPTAGDLAPATTSSPRTRGWSLGLPGAEPPDILFPAHAGVVPRSSRRTPTTDALPRARGGGPSSDAPYRIGPNSSPRTWGWSPGRRGGHETGHLFPAHAGVVPQ